MAEFAQIQNLGSWNALSDETFQGQIYNFGSFLVLRANIAFIQKSTVTRSNEEEENFATRNKANYRNKNKRQRIR